MVMMPILLNSFVHFLMYTYYLLSAFGPEVQDKINRWKKYITIIQMVNINERLGSRRVYIIFTQVILKLMKNMQKLLVLRSKLGSRNGRFLTLQ